MNISDMSKKGWFLLLVLLVLHLGILINIRFTAWPEMLSFPYLFVKGFRLYSDFIHPYPPLLTLLLAGFYKIFGFKIIVLKIVSWSFILVSDIFLFLITKKIFKKEFLAVLLLLPYILLQSFLDGNTLWFDNALVLPTVATLYYLINWSEKKNPRNLILAGIFLAAGIFIKQTGAIYFLVGAFFIGTKDFWRFAKLPMVLSILFLVYLVLTNSFSDFWLWNFYYPLTFWSHFPGYRDFTLSLSEKIVFGLTLLPLLGTFAIRDKFVKDKLFLLVIGFLAASIIAIYPRFSYFHLQPTLAILFVVFAVISSHLKRHWYLGLISATTLLAIYPTFHFSFIKSIRFWDENDQKVAKTISALSTKSERVYLLGLFSSMYVFSDRLPSKPWVDNFGWYWEVPKEADRILSRFEENPPDKIFYKVPERGEWFDLGVYRSQKLISYMYEHYDRESEPVGGIELWTRRN